jgi:hypothetical protein
MPDEQYVVVDDEESLAALTAWVDETQEHNRKALAQLRPDELARFERWLRTGTNSMPSMRSGRAPREAQNARRRGSRRGQRASSSSSDDPDPDPWDLGPSPPRIPGQIPLFMGWRR